jgi:hypothetical protein
MEHMASHGLKHTHDAFIKSEYIGLQYQTRWGPENFDVARMMEKPRKMGTMINELQSAIDAGTTVQAIDQHRALLLKAMHRGDVDEVVERMAGIRDTYAGDSLLKSETEAIDVQCETFKSVQGILKTLSETTGTLAPGSPMLGISDVLGGMRLQCAPDDAIRVVKISRDMAQGVSFNNAAKWAEKIKTRMKVFMTLYRKNSRNPKFLEEFAARSRSPGKCHAIPFCI